MDKVPFNHPWDEVRIGEVAAVIVGGTPSTSVPRYWGGTIRWMASGDVHQKRIADVPGRISEEGLNSSNAKLVEPPAVAIALAGQGKTRGTVGITLQELCTNQSVALLKPRTRRLNAAYLYHSLDFRYEELRGRSDGAGRAGLSKGLLESIPMPLPEERDQQKIAEVLDTVDRAIEETEALIAKSQRLQNGLMQDLFTRGIDEEGRLRGPATHKFRPSALGPIPAEWEVQTLSSLADPQTPICYGIVQVKQFVEGGVPTLAIRDLRGDYQTNIHHTAPSIEAQYTRSRVQPGDLLISIKGTTGRSDVVPNNFRGNISRDLARIRLKGGACPHFLKFYFESQFGAGALDLVTVGTTRKEISIAPLREVCVPLPPEDEQKLIAEMLGTQASLEAAEETRLRKLLQLKTGLMQDLLTGKVPVEPLLELQAAINP